MPETTLDEWIANEAIRCSLDRPDLLNDAVDRVIAALGDAVDLIAFGEALHGGEEILVLRNGLFQRLVAAHGYRAIAIESSFPRARIVNAYVTGHGPEADAAVWETGFSHGFGQLDANRELVAWMRAYNANAAHDAHLHFYGFDGPMEITGADSPRQLLHDALAYLAALDPASARKRRRRIDALLGNDDAWENPAAMLDPSQAIGLSPEATALRIETEELITELRIRRPERVARSDDGRYREAVRYATMARQLLNYHATLGRRSGERDRLVRGLGIRDLMMADNLAYVVMQERHRGKVLAFAHNSHLQRGEARWQLGPHALAYWPAGAHLDAALGARYAVIGSALGVSDANGIGPPEPGTLEARLAAAPGPVRFIPTHRGQALPAAAFDSLPIRTTSMRNPTYFPLTPESFTDFDWLVILDTTAYARGGPPLHQGKAASSR